MEGPRGKREPKVQPLGPFSDSLYRPLSGDLSSVKGKEVLVNRQKGRSRGKRGVEERRKWKREAQNRTKERKVG